jgi:hypothetical protein
MNRAAVLRRRIRWLTGLVMLGLVISGVTAIPIRWEVEQLVRWSGVEEFGLASHPAGSLDPLTRWIIQVRDHLPAPGAPDGFLYYGTDWLAFGHFVIALAFVGAWRDPARNRWLFDFGLLACALVLPYALIFGELRGIPGFWRLIDGAFGVIAAGPLWLCRRYARELESGHPT